MNLRDDLALMESYSHAALAAYIFSCGPFGIWVGSLGYDRRPMVRTMEQYAPMALPDVPYQKGWANHEEEEEYSGDIGSTVEWMVCECETGSTIWLEDETFVFDARAGRWTRI